MVPPVDQNPGDRWRSPMDLMRQRIDTAVPMPAAVVDNDGVISEREGRQPIVAHELPEIFHDLDLWAFRPERQQGEAVRHGDIAGEVPAGPIKQQHEVVAGAD